MISRRNYLSITILMVATLLLCMCLNQWKDSLNDYAVNQYTETAENYPSQVNIYLPGSGTGDTQAGAAGESGNTTVVPRRLVVCVGDEDQMSMRTTAEWVTYTKRNIAAYPTLAAYGAAGNRGELPEMLVVDPACVDWTSDVELDFLDKCLENGTHLVFCGLPEVSVVESSQRVRELFGIQSVQAAETTVEGFYLRDGFLLGGATFYLEKTGSDAEEPLPGSSAFPGERTFPWYLPSSGTKVYIKGVPEDKELKAEEYPIVLWRRSRGNGYVFAVNGGFMDGPEAIGLLSAMSAEMHTYEIYPVVNAQNIILAGYPSLADENQEEVNRLYGRSIKQVFQELLWPSISRFLQREGYQATCMMTPQYDYSDNQLPDGEQLAYYLKMFAEQSVETGLSLLSVSDTPLAEKLEADGRFFQDALGGYDIVSFYAGSMGDEEVAQALETEVLSSARTVVRGYDKAKAGLVGFLSENVTAQATLDCSDEYTYESDFLIRSTETALGYFSVSFDLTRVAYPEGNENVWEELSDVMASFVSTYGQQFPAFSRTTAAECDARIRQFLAMNYQQSRTGNRIELSIEGVSGPVWFILRTHNEAIQDMDGGTWEKLEDGAYLVEVTQESAVLIMGPADERYYR